MAEVVEETLADRVGSAKIGKDLFFFKTLPSGEVNREAGEFMRVYLFGELDVYPPGRVFVVSLRTGAVSWVDPNQAIERISRLVMEAR